MTNSYTEHDKNIKRKVQTYIDGVLSGQIITGKHQRLAVERHVKDLETGGERGLYFDEERALHVCKFFEKWLKHSKGEWSKKAFILEGWQAFVLFCIFGWMRADGTRRFRTAYISVARKNGKSTLAAGIALYLTVADNEPGAEVYSAATKKDQAKIVHNEAMSMVRKSKKLVNRVNLPTTRNPKASGYIYYPYLESKFEPLSSDENTMDGLNVHGAVVDELHAHKTDGVWTLITTATGSRRQPLVVAITTAGSSTVSICARQQSLCERILEGVIELDDYFAFICKVDISKNEDEPGDDWTDPEVWVKANPNLGVSAKLEDIESHCKKALVDPEAENDYKRLKLNIWTEQAKRYLSMEAWKACPGEFDLEELAGCQCYAGLDLASTEDTASFVLVFPTETERIVLPFFWVPEDTVVRRSKAQGIPYQSWVDHGHIIATPGNQIDYRRIRKKINELGDLYDIREIAYDSWAATEITQNLEEEDGFEVVPVHATFKNMHSPTQEVKRLVMVGALRHGNHPVLTWQASNLAIQKNSDEFIRPVKALSSGKIDGMVGLILGLSRLILCVDSSSVYKTRGIKSI